MAPHGVRHGQHLHWAVIATAMAHTHFLNTFLARTPYSPSSSRPSLNLSLLTPPVLKGSRGDSHQHKREQNATQASIFIAEPASLEMLRSQETSELLPKLKPQSWAISFQRHSHASIARSSRAASTGDRKGGDSKAGTRRRPFHRSPGHSPGQELCWVLNQPRHPGPWKPVLYVVFL